jgi:hypothetical protein
MIDEAQVGPLAHALESDPDPGNQRLLVHALTHLPLSSPAWVAASWLARGALRGLGDPDQGDPEVLELAARVPLRSVRDRLRHLASDPELAAALPSALALAEVGDPAGAATLAGELARGPGESRAHPGKLARALARLPLEGGLLEAEALRPALRSDEEGGDALTRMWGALALARLGEREPLEELWDALVRPPGFLEALTRRPLFTSPPELFHGAPGVIVGELAGVRPLPPAVVAFLEGLRNQDYDGEWSPRTPHLVEDPRDARAFLEGLLGEADDSGTDGGPVATDPEDRAAPLARRLIRRPWRGLHPDLDPSELPLLRAAPPELAAQLLESGIEALPVPDGPDPVDGETVVEAGNALVTLADHLPSGIPLPVVRILETPALQRLPRAQVAWVAARAGLPEVMKALTPRILAGEGEERTRWLTWLKEIAGQAGAPPPFLGHAGEGPGTALLLELVDDRPEERMVGAAPPSSESERAALRLSAAPKPHPEPRPPLLELFPDIATDTPHPVAGDPLVLTVSLALEASESTRGMVAIPDTGEPLILRTHLLLGEHSEWGELTWVTGQGTVDPAVFRLTTPGTQVAPASRDHSLGSPTPPDRALLEARVNFYMAHRWCGEASRHLDVRRDASVPPLDEIPPPEGPTWRTGLTLEPGAVPPDLIVRIQRGGGVGQYIWSCLSPHVRLSPPGDPADALMSLGSDAVTFVRQRFGARANRPLGRMDLADLEGIGEEIYRATPAHFKDSYWTVHAWMEQAGIPFTSIQIVTDEPFIPWELMRLDEPVRGPGVPAEFLGIRHSVGRWLAEHVGGPRQRIPLGEVAVAASDYDGIQGAKPLPWAGEERTFLETTHRATRVELRGEAVLDFLEGGTAHVVHFACHGQMSLQNPNDSILVMEDAPNHVRPTHVARGRVRDHGLGRQHPLVFLNACEVGGTAQALSLVAGFPAAFLQAGASALVSPLWVVNDERAFQIAREFYDTALAPGPPRPLGQLLRDVRARWEEEKHLTYLSYVLYGDPLAWVDVSAAPGAASPPPASPTPAEP